MSKHTQKHKLLSTLALCLIQLALTFFFIVAVIASGFYAHNETISNGYDSSVTALTCDVSVVDPGRATAINGGAVIKPDYLYTAIQVILVLTIAVLTLAFYWNRNAKYQLFVIAVLALALLVEPYMSSSYNGAVSITNCAG